MTTYINTAELSFNNGPFSGFRNRIHNGDFRINQRNASGLTTGIGALTYTLDRWIVYTLGAACTVSQFYGTGPTTTTINAIQVTGAASNSTTQVVQRIESVNIRDLASKTVTVSFWLFQNTGSTQTITVSSVYPTAIDNYTGQTVGPNFTASVPNNSWTYVTGQMALSTNVQYGFELIIGIPALLATQNMYITEVQLEQGSTATPFERRPYGTELSICQRYLHVWQSTAANEYIAMGLAYATGNVVVAYRLPVTMRTDPAFTSSGFANFSGLNSSASAVAATSFTANTVNKDTIGLVLTSAAASYTVGNASGIVSANTSASFTLSADL